MFQLENYFVFSRTFPISKKLILLLKIETCYLHINKIYKKVYLFLYLTLVCLIASHKEIDELIHKIFLCYLRANCRPKENSNSHMMRIRIWPSTINSHILKKFYLSKSLYA